jgi:hypothetical protein
MHTYKILYMFKSSGYQNSFSYVLKNMDTNFCGLLQDVCRLDLTTVSDDMLDPVF